MLNWLNDNGTGISATMAILTALVAIFGIVRTTKDSRERTRPVVAAWLREPPDSDQSIELVIGNIGSTIARKVRVTVDPQIDPGLAKSDRVVAILSRRFARTVEMLGPGQELTNIWWSNHHTGSGPVQNLHKLPGRFAVILKYEGQPRRLLPTRKFADRMELDTADIADKTYATSSNSIPGRMKSYDNSLVAIANSLKKLSMAMGSKPDGETVRATLEALTRMSEPNMIVNKPEE